MNFTELATDFSCRLAASGDQDAMVSTYRESFADDPVFQWIFPDEETRKSLLEKFFTVMIGHTFSHGGFALQAKDYGAVSMFFPPDAVMQPEEAKNHLLHSLRHELGPESEMIVHVLTTLDARHPKDFPPHYYGTFVAAHPQEQGNGLGTRLKRCVFALADQDGAGAYAEASSPRNLALYERLGQRRLGPAVTLPGGPQIFPIWRPPVAAVG
ncbi:GNAT family N-acetyltransferase [Streptomyces pinistramenti]|uniref:GNAT family N-acetyltransferase n=1 Tax=Streptomyces pinistramenti TaxID=2884812 RepID=UPI001D08592A|nr:GNAT family N-acetyltransferase [Streptomyces pinistramenti]MCB5912191.1 GNAT family N-acetyltransferase [Streptomyces pinistramenti]